VPSIRSITQARRGISIGAGLLAEDRRIRVAFVQHAPDRLLGSAIRFGDGQPSCLISTATCRKRGGISARAASAAREAAWRAGERTAWTRSLPARATSASAASPSKAAAAVPSRRRPP
jgi:hypothetical protein